MGVLLTDRDLDGESTYNDDLSTVVEELERDGTAVVTTARCACSSTGSRRR
jgi:arginyl-tRNA synthetase